MDSFDIINQKIQANSQWLSLDVFPLWTSVGFDSKTGRFREGITRLGTVLESPTRARVQTRQIYSLAEAIRMRILTQGQALPIMTLATDFLLEKFSLPNGSFVNAVDSAGQVTDVQADLYTQAFCLFALAQAFEFTKNPLHKERAKQLIQYLVNERKVASGGYTEYHNTKIVYQSNPHMHLFEAALAWMAVDKDSVWSELANSIKSICLNSFIDKETGLLAEHFTEDWQPLRSNTGHFIFEPGHQYEWAWLLCKFAELTEKSVGPAPLQLFNNAETFGVSQQSGLTLDEVWSDHSVSKRTSRFWPQSERIKVALVLGQLADKSEKKKFALAADQALIALEKFLKKPQPGQWEDTLSEDGEFSHQPSKASSLYHIINALSEYQRLRMKIEV